MSVRSLSRNQRTDENGCRRTEKTVRNIPTKLRNCNFRDLFQSITKRGFGDAAFVAGTTASPGFVAGACRKILLSDVQSISDRGCGSNSFLHADRAERKTSPADIDVLSRSLPLERRLGMAADAFAGKIASAAQVLCRDLNPIAGIPMGKFLDRNSLTRGRKEGGFRWTAIDEEGLRWCLRCPASGDAASPD